MVFRGHNKGRQWVFRSITAAIIVAIVALVADFIFGILSRRMPVHMDLSYYQNIIADQKVVALTFDDGPDPVKTPKIMEILKRYEVPATFFFMGSHALKYPEVVKMAQDAGFEIGNHTFSHSNKVHSSKLRLGVELNLTNKIIEGITGEPTELYRPPFLLDIGSDATIDPATPMAPLEWASNAGYVVVGVDIDSKDWAATSADEVYHRVVDAAEDGHIILLHDSDVEHYTVKSLERIIITLKERGYRFALASELLGLDAAAKVNLTANLRRGMTDDTTNGSVSALQTFLTKEGLYSDGIIGTFGPVTERVLDTWQRQVGIRHERGFVGPATRQKIANQLATAWPSRPKPATYLIHPIFQERLPRFSILSFSSFGGVLGWLIRIGIIFGIFRLLFMLFLRLLALFYPTRLPRRAWKKGVSVIIPVYNEEHNIKATVESVLRNTYAQKEIIVVDDGSTDKSAAIVKRLVTRHPETIRLIRTANGGKAGALNIGIREARHDVVVTMDGDTVFATRTIELLVGYFSDRNVGAVAGRVRVVHPRRLLNVFQHIEYTVAQNLDKTAVGILRNIGVVPGPVGAWWKADILAAGGYSTATLVEDQDLTLTLLSRGRKVLYAPQAVAYTETPYTLRDFSKQRFRWVFGTLQCLWKHKRNLFSLRHPVLGWVILPDTIMSSFFVALLMPLIDIPLVLAVIFGYWGGIAPHVLLFVAVDVLYSSLAFLFERNRHWSLALVPFQRLFYRAVIYTILVRSVVKALEGSEARWYRVRKRGDANELHLRVIGETVEIDD
ncbi:MAG: glycosyltransferase [Candidatus Kerfeldbacteria bacterium]|nr:glycosyltransferase [Candidatus Kerfeldbacteria bacterium]